MKFWCQAAYGLVQALIRGFVRNVDLGGAVKGEILDGGHLRSTHPDSAF